MLAVIYVRRPLDFAVFPTVLLGVTLLRLALNVASTRVVLLQRSHRARMRRAASSRRSATSSIGGNYAVGIVVFVILVVINFMVVTKGAGRVSEVTARFTLDAMPGKQMAIDADLNAGHDHARAGRRAAQRGCAGSRLLRRDGRRQQIRARRRGRRHLDSRHQRHRRAS